MEAFRNLKNSLNLIFRNPVTRQQKVRGFGSYMRWQIQTRLLGKSPVIPFIHPTKFKPEPGEGTGLSAFVPLYEFEEMAFVLHGIRPDDLFIDVGANVGIYSILASGAAGAQTLAFEPTPKTFERLLENIRINGLESKILAHQMGLGAVSGKAQFETSGSCTNRVLSDEETSSRQSLEVEIRRLDEVLALNQDAILKIDVEGFETKVLEGAARTLHNPHLFAIITEAQGYGSRYGDTEETLHRILEEAGFFAVEYFPLTRELRPATGGVTASGNAVFIRDIEAVKKRVLSARPFILPGGQTL